LFKAFLIARTVTPIPVLVVPLSAGRFVPGFRFRGVIPRDP
jgi:hypothetical protein